jgi:hypothetical protein
LPPPGAGVRDPDSPNVITESAAPVTIDPPLPGV